MGEGANSRTRTDACRSLVDVAAPCAIHDGTIDNKSAFAAGDLVPLCGRPCTLVSRAIPSLRIWVYYPRRWKDVLIHRGSAVVRALRSESETMVHARMYRRLMNDARI